MEKFARLFTAAGLVCGLAFAQEDASKPSTPAGQAESSSSAKAGNPSLLAVQNWRGTLVDASCASGSGSGASQEKAGVDTGRPQKGHKNRAAESCPVASSTSTFALRTDSGQVMKFDAIGNARAAETLKTKPGWTKDLSGGKPIRAKVSGMLNGDTITVTSIS